MEIKNLNAKSRIQIYQMLQYLDELNFSEIEKIMSWIDQYLFENQERNLYGIFAEHEDGENILAFAAYGQSDDISGQFSLYFLLFNNNLCSEEAELEVLHFIEKDVVRKKGRKLVVELKTVNDFQNKILMYQRHHFQTHKRIKDFYAPGVDKIVLTKSIPHLVN